MIIYVTNIHFITFLFQNTSQSIQMYVLLILFFDLFITFVSKVLVTPLPAWVVVSKYGYF